VDLYGGIPINIVSTQYSLKYKALEIIHSGCDGICPECHSKELWDFDLGSPLVTWLKRFEDKFNRFNNMIDMVFIYGGEPLLQTEYELLELIKYVKRKKKEIVLFTRFEIDEVHDEVKNVVDYIKTGTYDTTKKEKVIYYGITLETSNQKVWKKDNDKWI